jgi:uncharacterized cupin superfamily protein
VVPEAPLERTDTGGLQPQGEGWFVVNAGEAHWQDSAFGPFTRFEGTARFPQVGINIGVLQPGQPGCMYHGENDQENFLVLSGECLLLIEGEERRLKTWDFVHCPPWTEHVFVGAGDGPCTILAIGSRSSRDLLYPVSELAQQYGASVERETRDGSEAYAGYEQPVDVEFHEDWLPS